MASELDTVHPKNKGKVNVKVKIRQSQQKQSPQSLKESRSPISILDCDS